MFAQASFSKHSGGWFNEDSGKMIIGRYLQWVETAPVKARVDAARTLVEIYASPDLGAAGRSDAELALFALLDDRAAVVRRALAEAVAHAVRVPRHLVAALAQDQSVVASPVLRHSPMLDDADLIDAVAIGDECARKAVAERQFLRAEVVAALVEVGDADTMVALCRNDEAEVSRSGLRRILDRFRDDGAVREALLERGDLDPTLRHDLVVATTEALTGFATRCAWMSPARAEQVSRECRDKAAITVATRSARHDGAAGLHQLAAHLRRGGHLTPALMLRALLSGNVALFEAGLVELSNTTPIRVAGHVRDAGGLAFAALYGRAGLPQALLPVFRAALSAFSRDGDAVATSGALDRTLIVRVLDACQATQDPGLARVSAMLRRFEAEAVRDEARAVAANAWAEDAAEAVPALLPWITGAQQTAPRLTFQSAA